MTEGIYYPKTNVSTNPLNYIVDCPVFGWETEERWAYIPNSPSPDDRGIFNFFRVVSYLPLVHLVTGVAQCIFGLYILQVSERNDFYMHGRGARVFYRGVLTAVFGPALLIADYVKYKLQQSVLERLVASGAQRYYL